MCKVQMQTTYKYKEAEVGKLRYADTVYKMDITYIMYNMYNRATCS